MLARAQSLSSNSHDGSPIKVACSLREQDSDSLRESATLPESIVMAESQVFRNLKTCSKITPAQKAELQRLWIMSCDGNGLPFGDYQGLTSR